MPESVEKKEDLPTAVRHERQYVPEAGTGQQEPLITKVRDPNCVFARAFRYCKQEGRASATLTYAKGLAEKTVYQTESCTLSSHTE